MSDFRERSNSWSSVITPSSATDGDAAPWRNLGTSMSAISFGFVATAILISMFLIMAIFEHLVRQRSSFLLTTDNGEESSVGFRRNQMHLPGKLGNSQNVASCYHCDVSVLMPGQNYPTYIAQPAPIPLTREGISWPSHDQHIV